MNTASILIKTDPKLKAKAQKTAEKMGVSLTSVINNYLKEFAQNKKVIFSVDDEVPNARTAKLLKQSEADVKAGKVITFKSRKEELDYLDQEIENEKRRISSD